jgi:hypothetical protein
MAEEQQRREEAAIEEILKAYPGRTREEVLAELEAAGF